MKGLSINLKILMGLALVVIAVMILVGLLSDNVNWLSSYGNQSINSSIGAVK